MLGKEGPAGNTGDRQTERDMGDSSQAIVHFVTTEMRSYKYIVHPTCERVAHLSPY